MKKVVSAKNGIELKDSISVSIRQKESIFSKVPLIFIAFSAVFGLLSTFLSLFSFQVDRNLVYLFTTAFFVVMSTIFMMNKKMWVVLLPLSFIYEMIFFKCKEIFILGYKVTYNVIIQKLNNMGNGIQYYRIDESVNTELVTTVFFIFMMFLLTMVLCYIAYIRHSFILGFLITFPFLEIGLYKGIVPSYPSVMLLILFWTTLFALSLSGHGSFASRDKTGFIRKENTFYAKKNIKFNVVSGLTLYVSLITLISITLSILIPQIMGYERTEKIDKLSQEIETYVDEFSFDEFISNFTLLRTSIGNGTTANTGKLGQYTEINFKNKLDLTVTVHTDGNAIPDGIYMKGYTGSKYTGKSWDMMSRSEQKNNSEMLDRLAENNIHPQTLVGDVMNTVSQVLYPPYSSVNSPFGKYRIDIEISGKKGHRYNYVPYGIMSGNYNYVSDTTIQYDNKKDYSFEFIGMLGHEEALKTEVWKNQSVAGLEEYEKFVHEYYTQLPDSNGIQQVKEKYSDVTEANSLSIYDKLCLIRDAIQADTEYTLSPGKTPSNRDFVSYFLLENHKGYCSHYASAGAILCRLAGIPARYVEGYVVQKDDFSAINRIDENNYRIPVKDRRAHAWAEIYIDGFGWVPFEFTPGYDETNVEPVATTIDTPITTTVTPPETTVSTENANLPAQVTTTGETSFTTVVESGERTTGIPGNLIPEEKTLNINSFLVILIMILLVVGLIFAKYKVIIYLRIKRMTSGEPGERMIAIYKYAEQLLDFLDISKSDKITFEEYKEQVSRKTELITYEEISEIIDMVLQSEYGNARLTEQELKKAMDTVNGFADRIYKQLPQSKQFTMRYIDNLI